MPDIHYQFNTKHKNITLFNIAKQLANFIQQYDPTVNRK